MAGSKNLSELSKTISSTATTEKISISDNDITLSASLITGQGADVASAAALTLGADGNVFDITGTTAITSIVTKGVGAHITLQFDSILLLTHHAVNLILPGAANIITAPGDVAVFYEYSLGDWRCVSYTKAAGTSEIELLTSLITRKFYAGSSAGDFTWREVVWASELQLFVAVCNNGTTQGVMTSIDGESWVMRNSPTQGWNSVVWSPELTLFVAVGTIGTGNRVMTSPDGITWTIGTSAGDNPWQSVTWSPELTLFVATAGSGAQRVMTSPDGFVWTLRDTPAIYAWNSVTWSPKLGLFAAIASNITEQDIIMTSTDGINWISRTSPDAANISLYGITWSPKLALFAAVASTGTYQVLTSPDGITWTGVTVPAFAWYAITWAEKLGIFMAVSITSGAAMWSRNAIDWHKISGETINQWQSVCWSPEFAMFVTVSIDGTGDRVMHTK